MASSKATHKRRIFRFGGNRLNLFLDIALALAFVVVMEQRFTGLTLHELIGVAFGVGLLVHIVLHWRWILSITRRFFQKPLHPSRFNYALNLLLFADMLVIMVTGLGISRTLGLNLNLERSSMQNFERLHLLASNLSLLIVALHVGLHWKWIVNHAQRYIFRLPLGIGKRRALTPTPHIESAQPSAGGAQ